MAAGPLIAAAAATPADGGLDMGTTPARLRSQCTCNSATKGAHATVTGNSSEVAQTSASERATQISCHRGYLAVMAQLPVGHVEFERHCGPCRCRVDDEQKFGDCYASRLDEVELSPDTREAAHVLAVDGFEWGFEELIRVAERL